MKAQASMVALAVAASWLFAASATAQQPVASLSVTEHKSDGNLGLTFTLINRGKTPLWINRRMSVEEDSCREQVGEIRLKIVDARGRIVPFACSQKSLAAQNSDYGLLRPGEKATSRFNEVDECYFFEGGETLTVYAHYMDANATPPPAPTGSSPLKGRVEAEPLKVRVPARAPSHRPAGSGQ